MGFGSLTLGLNLGYSPAVSSGGSSLAAPTATFTVAGSQPQLIAGGHVLQRYTRSGGVNGTGFASCPIVLTAATTGTFNARFSSGGATRGDLKAEWAAGTITVGGAQTIDVTGIDVQRNFGYIDVRDASGWTNGTVLVGPGLVLFGPIGQSLAEAFSLQGDVPIATALGHAVDPYIRIFGSNTTYSTATVTGLTWEAPGDLDASHHHPGAGAAALLEKLSLYYNGCLGMAQHAVAGSNQQLFQWKGSGTANAGYAQAQRIANAIGNKWELEWWFGGHNESEAGVEDHYYQADIDQHVFGTSGVGGFAGLNNINIDGLTSRTGGVKRFVSAAPILRPSPTFYYGRTSQVLGVIKGGKDWCVAKHDGTNTNGVYIDAPAMITSDGIHERASGGIEIAVNASRAMISDNQGPLLTAAARDATNPNKIILTFTNLGTDFQLSGNWWLRAAVYISGGTLNNIPVTGGAKLSSTQLSITLQAPVGGGNWGDGDLFDVFMGAPYEGVTSTPAADMIRDNRTDVFDAVNGRSFVQTAVAITAAPLSVGAAKTPTANYPNTYVAPKSMLDLNANSVTYDSVEHLTGFGKPMIAGNCSSPLSFTGNGHQLAYSTVDMTIVCRIKTPSAYGSGNKTIFQFGQFGIFLASSTGKVFVSGQDSGATASSPAGLLNSHVYWVAAVMARTGTWIYVWDGTTLSRSTIAAATPAPYSISGGAVVANATGSDFLAGGLGASIFECAMYDTALYSSTGFTPPSTPLVGTETNLKHLWPLTLENDPSLTGVQKDLVRPL